MRASLAEAPQPQESILADPELYLVPNPVEQAETASRPELHLVPPMADHGLVETDVATVRPELYAVPDPVESASTEVSYGQFINADTIPELSVERQKAAKSAAKILAQNRDLLETEEAYKAPTPIDVLGTASQVIEAKQKYGADSAEYKELRKGLELDNERLIGEASTRNISEYFPTKKQLYQEETNEFFSHGLSISKMTANGLSPTAEPTEEQPRRINEVVEEDGTYVPLGSLIARQGLQQTVEQLRVPVAPKEPELSMEVTTISECTDFAIKNYETDKKGAHGGYRPGMKGMAIRRVHFEDDSGNRSEEQVIISGIYITHDLIEEVLVEKEALKEDQKLNKTELHGTQFVSVNEGSVMEFVRELDEKASQVHGKHIFMGEEVDADHPRDYDEFVEEAEERRKRLAPLPVQMTDFLEGLVENGISSKDANARVNAYLKDKLLSKAKQNPELARAIFDEATAQGYEEVARLNSLGLTNQAEELEASVREAAPAPSYCGAGDTKTDSKKDSESNGECTFISKNCPKCGEENVFTVSTDEYTKGFCKQRCIVFK